MVKMMHLYCFSIIMCFMLTVCFTYNKLTIKDIHFCWDLFSQDWFSCGLIFIDFLTNTCKLESAVFAVLSISKNKQINCISLVSIEKNDRLHWLIFCRFCNYAVFSSGSTINILEIRNTNLTTAKISPHEIAKISPSKKINIREASQNLHRQK